MYYHLLDKRCSAKECYFDIGKIARPIEQTQLRNNQTLNLSLDFLSNVFELFKDKFNIYYIRYSKSKDCKGYYDDAIVCDFKDYELIEEKHPYVSTVYDVMKEYDINHYNEAQLMILSKSEHHITTNGGNSVLSAYFGGDVFIHGHPRCFSTSRGIWKTDSWLKFLGGANICGLTNYQKIIERCKEKWLD